MSEINPFGGEDTKYREQYIADLEEELASLDRRREWVQQMLEEARSQDERLF